MGYLHFMQAIIKDDAAKLKVIFGKKKNFFKKNLLTYLLGCITSEWHTLWFIQKAIIFISGAASVYYDLAFTVKGLI